MPIIKFLKGIRNHWKKTAFGCFMAYYAGNYTYNYYDNRSIMRKYCAEAVTYGDQTIDALTKPKKLVVLLNPAANKKSAEKMFDEYCKPILNLGGYLIEIIPTDSVGHARRYIEDLEKLPDAVVVAGGDGTIAEVITGLMRRPNHDQCPVGILPVGRTNSTIRRFFNLNDDEVLGLAKTAIAVVKQNTVTKDVLKIERITEGEDETSAPKPIYAMNSLQWGAYIDAINLRDKYWYFGPLREYAASLFNAFGEKLQWNCDSELIYTPPCTGCKNCAYSEKPLIEQKSSSGRWWSHLVPRFKLGHQQVLSPQLVDYSRIVNDDCTKETSIEVHPSEILLQTENDQNLSKFSLKIENEMKSSFDFIKKSWRRINDDKSEHSENFIEGRTVILKPNNQEISEETDRFYYIDNEPYEVRPIRISIVPKAVNIFTL